MAGWSLKQRCTYLRDVYGVTISASGLWQFYKKYKIKPRYSNFTYRRSLPGFDLPRQILFATKLVRLMRTDAQIIYFDEASVNVWMRRHSTYAGPGMSIKTPINSKLHQAITIYAAIGSMLGSTFHYTVGRTTNTADMLRFVNTLRQPDYHHSHASQRIFMVLDNARCHHSAIVLERMEELGITPLFMPPYSPEFNSIERVWATVKSNIIFIKA